MKNYRVTKAVTGMGYIAGIGFIVLSGIIGLMAAKFMGLIMGLLGGAILAVPLLLICEMSIAIVAMEENTRQKN